MGWIGVDLDSTLAEYTEWKGPEHIGRPIPLMVARVKKWLNEGKDVRIFTARVADKETADVARQAIKEWCREHIGRVLPITCIKDNKCEEIWDDRAVSIEPNLGELKENQMEKNRIVASLRRAARTRQAAKETASVRDQIVEFFKTHSAPGDDEIHALAGQLGLTPEAFEAEIYKLLADLLKSGGPV